jgi:hypothetical protein
MLDFLIKYEITLYPMNRCNIWLHNNKGDKMKKPLFEEKININSEYSIQLEPHNQEDILIYKNDHVLESFALNRKTYTFFKLLQQLIQAENYYTIEGNKGDLYGLPIHIKDGVYMKITNEYACLSLKFYKQTQEGESLLFLTTLTYTIKDLYRKLFVPFQMHQEKNYIARHVFKFLDMILLLNDQKQKKEMETS